MAPRGARSPGDQGRAPGRGVGADSPRAPRGGVQHARPRPRPPGGCSGAFCPGAHPEPRGSSPSPRGCCRAAAGWSAPLPTCTRPLVLGGARPGSPLHPSSAVYYFDDPLDKPDAGMLTGFGGGPRLLAFSRCYMHVYVHCMCSNLEARTGLLNCGHPTLIVFMRRGPNVSCSLPGSVKLEAPCQRSRVHWLGTRMPWRDYNFSKRRDLAAESRFSLVSKLAGSGVVVALEKAVFAWLSGIRKKTACVLVLFCVTQ